MPEISVVDVYSLWLAPDDRAERDAWSLLTTEEQARAAQFRNATDRAARVRTRALLRTLLARELDLDPRAVPITEGRYGKPELGGRHGPLHFNVSHSGARAVVALCRSHSIGVDIEKVRALDWRAVADAHFAPAEITAIAGRAPAERLDAFFDSWVAKEAYLKGVGVGLKRRTDDFVVPSLPSGAPVRDDDADRRGVGLARWYLHRLDVDDGYAAALAVAAPNVAVAVRRADSVAPGIGPRG
jgi:4'-phosphopantetheinyl transferase